jgi:hypothetical protein
MTIKKMLLLIITLHVILIITFSLSSCNNWHNKKALSDLIKKTTYDTSIIRNLPLYDTLKEILVANLDTIFKFRDARAYVYHGSGEDSGQTTHERHHFYIFFYNWNLNHGSSEDDISPKTLPAFVYPVVKHFFEALGKEEIASFTIWTDSGIVIGLPNGYIDERTRASVRHTLRWNRIVDLSHDPLSKDTIVAPGWYYEITVTEYEDQ